MTRMTKTLCEILAPLPWDTQSFGFPVARITSATAKPTEVADALAAAQAQGLRLVYWSSAAQHLLPAALLTRFAGALVDRRATFRRDLAADDKATGWHGSEAARVHSSNGVTQLCRNSLRATEVAARAA
jgi:hypothetical protein